MGLEPTTLALGGLRAIHCATGACLAVQNCYREATSTVGVMKHITNK